jgi:PhnB protein
MRMNTYVNFQGNCAEAFRYYERHLGARVDMMMTHSQSPGSHDGPDWKDAVLHARISIGDVELWAADIPKAEPMRSAYLSLRLDSDHEAVRVFSVLSDRGRVLMPIEQTFFAFRFGQVQDQFGINWMILHERPLPPQR